jgi:putative protease
MYLRSESEIERWKNIPGLECILAAKDFSRRGTLEIAEALSLAQKAESHGLKTSWEWDALMEEPRFRLLTKKLMDLPLKRIRVRDAGAAVWVRDNTTWDIQLLLEAGHHNILAIRSWQQRLGARLKRVILSPELPASTLKKWRQELACEMEILALGPLLLFHSPRALLSSLESAPEGSELWASGASEESPHKGFPLQENTHGTLMFHPKDLSLIERWETIAQNSVDIVRLDHRQESDETARVLEQFLIDPSVGQQTQLKASWSKEWLRGYWDVNKSDVLFEKLKNPHLSYQDTYCGEVLEGKKEAWLAVKIQGAGIKKGSTIRAVNPKGGERVLQLMWLKDENFAPVDELNNGQVGFIPWASSMPSRSQLHSS